MQSVTYPSFFKYLDVDLSFDIDLQLDTSAELGGYAYEIGNDEKTIRNWLTCLEQKATQWVMYAYVGSERQFDGPTERVWLTPLCQHH